MERWCIQGGVLEPLVEFLGPLKNVSLCRLEQTEVTLTMVWQTDFLLHLFLSSDIISVETAESTALLYEGQKFYL